MNPNSQFPAMRASFRFALAALVLGQLAGFVQPASAQVVVYKMLFTSKRAFNLDFYNSGYYVAPANGGDGKFIFTADERGPYTYTASGTGLLFPVVKKSGEMHWAIRGDNSTTGSSGTDTTAGTPASSSSYLAFGPLDKWVTLESPLLKLRVKIATHLSGSALASADESNISGAKTADVGFASTFVWKLVWERELTEEANRNGQDVAGAITALTEMLKSHGYSDEDATTTTNTNTSVTLGETP